MDPHPLETWHFFRRHTEADLWCAVEAHQALPAFLLSGEWCFSGHQAGSDDGPPGFDTTVAAMADHFNGFYLFQLTGTPQA